MGAMEPLLTGQFLTLKSVEQLERQFCAEWYIHLAEYASLVSLSKQNYSKSLAASPAEFSPLGG